MASGSACWSDRRGVGGRGPLVVRAGDAGAGAAVARGDRAGTDSGGWLEQAAARAVGCGLAAAERVAPGPGGALRAVAPFPVVASGPPRGVTVRATPGCGPRPPRLPRPGRPARRAGGVKGGCRPSRSDAVGALYSAGVACMIAAEGATSAQACIVDPGWGVAPTRRPEWLFDMRKCRWSGSLSTAKLWSPMLAR